MIDWDRNGVYSGRMLTFRYFVGTQYNGMHYTVSIDQNSSLTRQTGTVTGGYITFTAVNAGGSISVELISG